MHRSDLEINSANQIIDSVVARNRKLEAILNHLRSTRVTPATKDSEINQLPADSDINRTTQPQNDSEINQLPADGENIKSTSLAQNNQVDEKWPGIIVNESCEDLDNSDTSCLNKSDLVTHSRGREPLKTFFALSVNIPMEFTRDLCDERRLKFPKNMQAIAFNPKIKEVKYVPNYPMPKITKNNEVLVKVAYSGVCGTDLHIIQGEFPACQDRSFTLGHEFSGVIQEVGKEVVLKKGQRVVVDPNSQCLLCEYCRKGRYQYCSVKNSIGVWTDGGWAQYIVVPQDYVYPIPDGVTLEQASLCEPYSCVSHGFDRASPLSVADRVLVLGAGIIGNLWLTTLHLHGHRDVTVSEMNKARLEIVKQLDLGYRLVTPDVLEKERQEYDVIIDCTGVAKVFEISIEYMKPGGKYVLFGCAPQKQRASIAPFEIFERELTVIGVKVNPFSFPNSLGWLKSMGNRYLDYKKLGIKTYPLSQFQEAIADLKSGTISKAMFKIE